MRLVLVVWWIALCGSMAWAGPEDPVRVEGPAQAAAGDVIDVEDRRPYRDPRFDHRLRVHLRGIDAPELSQTCIVEEKKRWFCGTAAHQALSGFLGKRPVSCGALETDARHRTFGDCTVEGQSLAEWLVVNGWALADPQSGERWSAFEAQAKIQRKGIWNSRFDPPWSFREETERLFGIEPPPSKPK